MALAIDCDHLPPGDPRAVEVMAEAFDKNDRVLRSVHKRLCLACARRLFDDVLDEFGESAEHVVFQ